MFYVVRGYLNDYKKSIIKHVIVQSDKKNYLKTKI